jgi:general secretion pathway protein D
MSLARIARISTNDFSVTMPSALLQAMMSDQSTRVMQSPQLRASNNEKATLKIGQKVPIASGGMQPYGVGTTGVGGYGGGLYSSFQYLDVGVNVDMTPQVHGNDEVTLKVKLEISQVVDHVDIAGISQPIIGQRTVEHVLRIREGEASLLAGLMQDQDTKTSSGVPGLANVPGLKWLFSSQSVTRDRGELLIALIPHIVRTPGITSVNLRTIAAGTEQVTKVSLAPRAAPGPSVPPSPPLPGMPAPPAQPAPAQPAPAPPAMPTHLLLRPSTVQVQPGATFTIQFDADNARDLFSAPFHLKFDPQVLKLLEIKAGTLLASDGKTILFTRNILNNTGDATVELRRMPDTGGINGTGGLAVFTFQAVKPGTALVSFSEVGAWDSQKRAISKDSPQASITVK